MSSWLEEFQGVKIDARNINNLRYADDTTIIAESEGKPKSLFMIAVEESVKVGLTLNIKMAKIMESGPIVSWQIEEENKWKQWQILLSWALKITADSDCIHEDSCFLVKKAMANLGSISKSRDITLPINTHVVDAFVFPVAMYGCESLTIKAEHQRNGAFEMWC